MANTATAQTAISAHVAGADAIIPVVVDIDTTAEDLIIHSPDSDKYCALLGVLLAESDPGAITVKSGSTTLAVLQLGLASGAESRLIQPIDKPMLITALGQDLVIQSSVGLTTFVMYVAEKERFHF